MTHPPWCRGVAAEELAAHYLQTHGLEIVARNLRCQLGELDLVCLDADVLAVIEVRQRGSHDFGGALCSVTWRKQRRIIRATQFFMAKQALWRTHAVRFDVFAVEGRPDSAHQVHWVKDAFRPT